LFRVLWFSNRAVDAGNSGIEDLAPTAPELFGVPVPAWIEGQIYFAPLRLQGRQREA
jgi:hypothetical protein